MKEEYIICAAICDPEVKDMTGKNPLIHCGLRHVFILWQGENVSRRPSHQGFLTSKNRFVDRLEGLEIAIKMKQVDENKLSNRKIGLFSEDLY